MTLSWVTFLQQQKSTNMHDISLMHSSVAGNNFVGFETPIQKTKHFWGNFEQPER